MRTIAGVLTGVLLMYGCQSGEIRTHSPKPRMYPRIELPEPQYEQYMATSDCGFVFHKSRHATVTDRTSFFDEQLENDCWFDLKYPTLNASIHFTYYPVGESHTYQDLASESFQMVYEHSAIASGIDEIPIVENGREKGMAFVLSGPVASPYQFFLSDTSDHFLRAALYFNARPNPDSIAPVLDYILTDLDTLVKSFQWR